MKKTETEKRKILLLLLFILIIFPRRFRTISTKARYLQSSLEIASPAPLSLKLKTEKHEYR